jgi:ABC-2 type transport system permease protein
MKRLFPLPGKRRAMRNTWLVARREYLERVRTKAFVISTVLIPALMATFTVLPTWLASRESTTGKHIVVAVSAPALGNEVRAQILKRSANYTVDVETDTSDAARNQLKARVGNGSLDGFLWATDEAIAKHKLVFTGKETGDFIQTAELQSAVFMAQLRSKLGATGMSGQAMDDMLKSFSIDTIRIQKGKESKTSGMSAMMSTIVLMIMLYMTLVLYGVMVMRSVLEEKNSRIVEVMLASVTPKELMAGKILGVGAAGLTQLGIWAIAASVLGGVGAMGARLLGGASFTIEPRTLVFLPIFFLLGFLLYSTAFAALGAAVNNEQEAQQLQMIVMLPLIIAISTWFMVLREPNSVFATVVSLFPLTAPIMMYLRLVVSEPPVWQVALSIALMLATIYGMVAMCARIYRVGILMYGKKPTLPEIIRWLKYA